MNDNSTDNENKFTNILQYDRKSIIKQDIRIYVPIAGQTAGPIGLKFFVDTLRGSQGVT